MAYERKSDAESLRLGALERFAIMDTPAEAKFDEITRLAAAALAVPYCAISLVAENRQWFKSRVGIDMSETRRDQAFCAHAVEARAFLEVSDARLDPRFEHNPLVSSDEGIRFYAGAPLIVEGGYCLGTLCVFDSVPRAKLDRTKIQILNDLARLTADLIQARQSRRMGEVAAMVVDATSDAILCVDREGLITFWNDAAETIFGHAASVAIGQHVDLILHQSHIGSHGTEFAKIIEACTVSPAHSTIETSARRRDETEFPVELSLARWGDAADGGFAAIVRDITGRKRLERERNHAKDFLNTIISHLPAMLFVKDVATRKYLLVNRAGEDLIGLPANEIIGNTDRELFAGAGADYEGRDTQAIASGVSELFESDFERADGDVVSLRTRRVVIDGPDTPAHITLGLSEDVTDIRRAEARVVHLAHYDSLTGLLNRTSLHAKLEKLVAESANMAMLSIDLDRFKSVNDQYGHLAGDEVLAAVGQRLSSTVRSSDIVARMGGDEFLILLVDDEPAATAKRVANSVIRALSEPFSTHRVTVNIGASIGVVVAPQDGETVYDLRHGADLALYRAKAQGRGSICFFSRDMDAEAQERRALERDLAGAVDRGEIDLVFQPVISAATGRITSAEALARWTHIDRGSISPTVFIPLAEECGLVERLGRLVLQNACAAATTWPDHIRLAVNLSPLQFESGDLVGVVQQALAASGLAPARLQLEVTEGLVIRDVDKTFGTLSQLRLLGIQILMDDFGIGYSSLSYFERFPFDKVKIDRSFVNGLHSSKAARAIIRAVVELGSTLGIGVVAEGVETEAQRRALVAVGCTHLQGFLFGRPMTNADFKQIVVEEEGVRQWPCQAG